MSVLSAHKMTSTIFHLVMTSAGAKSEKKDDGNSIAGIENSS